MRELYRFASKIHEGKPKIFIAMPNQGNICPKNVVNLIKWFMAEEYTLQFYGPDDMQPHDRARNMCAKAFMETDFEYLLFMDEQTAPEPSYLDILLKADKPVVSGIAQTIKTGKHKPPFVSLGAKALTLAPLAFRTVGKTHAICYGSGLTEVDITSCAFMLIKREVIEKVHEKFGPPFSWNRLTNDEKWGINGYSEDFDFCLKVGEAGFKMYAHYGCLCMHQQRADMRILNQMLLKVVKKEKMKQRIIEENQSEVMKDDSKTRSDN